MEIHLITTRNIYESTGEYKLIKRRAEELYNQYNIVTKVISFQRQSRIDITKFEDEEDFQYVVKSGFSKNTFLSDLMKFRKKLKEYLHRYRPKKIILSGKFLLFYNIIKQYHDEVDCDIYLDFHGCNEEAIEYGSSIKLPINKYKLLISDYYDKKMLMICSGVLVVSESLKKHILTKHRLNNVETEFHIIPCGNYDTINNYEQRLKYRTIWRKKLGIKDDETVFVYSGGISKWQKIDETILFLQEIVNEYENTKVCIFSGQIKELEDKVNKLGFNNKVILKSLKSKEVPLVLTACDVGIILRENNLTNQVAFPTKFTDYLEGGLHVILSSVKSQIDYINKYDLGLAFEQISDLSIKAVDNGLKKIMKERMYGIENYYKKCDDVIDRKLSYKSNIVSFAKDILK